MLDLIGRERKGEEGRPDKPLRAVGQASKSALPSGEHYSLLANMTFNQWLSLVRINGLALSKCVSGRRWALVLLGTTGCAGGQREKGALGGGGGLSEGLCPGAQSLSQTQHSFPPLPGLRPQSQALRDGCFYTSISRHSRPCPSLNLASSGHSTAGRHPGPPGMNVLSEWDIVAITAITSLPPWALEYVCPKCLTLSQESSSFSQSGHNTCVKSG